jgi:hypothetical protein
MEATGVPSTMNVLPAPSDHVAAVGQVSSRMDVRVARLALVRALQNLVEKDAQLLEADANERSITHKLAEHLQREFGEEWHVDCEYNRDGHDPKRLALPPRDDVRSDDTEARTVFPDVIVHLRNSAQNFMVVEAKKANNPRGDVEDRQKLDAFQEQLRYKVAVLVRFETGSTVSAVATFLGDQPTSVRVFPGRDPIWDSRRRSAL